MIAQVIYEFLGCDFVRHVGNRESIERHRSREIDIDFNVLKFDGWTGIVTKTFSDRGRRECIHPVPPQIKGLSALETRNAVLASASTSFVSISTRIRRCHFYRSGPRIHTSGTPLCSRNFPFADQPVVLGFDCRIDTP